MTALLSRLALTAAMSIFLCTSPLVPTERPLINAPAEYSLTKAPTEYRLTKIPAEVEQAAENFVLERVQSAQEHTPEYEIDDWRILTFHGPYFLTAGQVSMEIWNVRYELHAAAPEKVVLAGGSYLEEDGWCMLGYPGCDYLYFQREEDGTRKLLYSSVENDCGPDSGSPMFWMDMVYALEDRELLSFSELNEAELLRLLEHPPTFFIHLAEAQEREAALQKLGAYLAQESMRSEYAALEEELKEGGLFYEDLTDGGRAAWERLQDLVERGK